MKIIELIAILNKYRAPLSGNDIYLTMLMEEHGDDETGIQRTFVGPTSRSILGCPKNDPVRPNLPNMNVGATRPPMARYPIPCPIGIEGVAPPSCATTALPGLNAQWGTQAAGRDFRRIV